MHKEDNKDAEQSKTTLDNTILGKNIKIDWPNIKTIRISELYTKYSDRAYGDVD